MNKTTLIKIRATPAEKTSWLTKAKKAGISLSEYLRRCASFREIPSQPPEINYHLALQLGQISNNLNQQVLAMNAAIGSEQEIADITQTKEAIAQLHHLLKTIQAQLLSIPKPSPES
ncbi:MAG TPA: hypothetical protein DD379_19100 [Cyanobacteria bacterium UBA11162]|nr:hypothetical protein [Cyanobacteria bacterium UBA11162]